MAPTPTRARAATTDLDPGSLIDGLFSAGHDRSLAARQFLFCKDDVVHHVYLIRHGRLQMLRHLACGTAVVIHTGRAGETFAEAALFADRYHCDARAGEAAVVACCGKDDLRAALAASPLLAFAWMETITRHLHAARTLLEVRSIRSAEARVLQHLRLRADEAGEVVLAGRLLDVAAELGLTQEAYYRSLSALCRAGVIGRARGSIRLLDTKSQVEEETRPCR